MGGVKSYISSMIWKKSHDDPIHPNKITEAEMTLINLKLVRDKIKASIHNLEYKEKEFKKLAKAYLKEDNRERARNSLNRSKIFRIQIDNANAMLFTILEQISMLEKAQIESETFLILKKSNAVLKSIQINVEKFQEIKEDMKNVKESQDEIREFLTNHNLNDHEFNNEIDCEMERLEKALKEGEKTHYIEDNNSKSIVIMDKSLIDEANNEENTKSKIICNIIKSNEKEIKNDWVLI
jgi:hypothetical protein